MSLSSGFIERPIGTTLLTIAVALAGGVAYFFLPVSPLPQVEFPTINVNANLPGASPETMASSVATPLERQFGRIAGVTEMTSTSSLGSTSIVLQFDLSRNVDAAARDVQAAINAARGQLPANLPSNPNYRKVNPADAPIMLLGLVSDVVDKGRIYDIASSVLQQRIAQIEGVGQVFVGGGALPAVRVEVNPTALNNAGLSLEDVRGFLSSQNANRPKGQIGAAERAWAVGATDQLLAASQYKPLVLSYRGGGALRLSDVADVVDSVEDVRTAGVANGKPADPDHHLPPARRQHHRHRRPDQGAPAAAAGRDPADDPVLRRARPLDDDPRLGPRRPDHARDLDRARHPRRLRVPAQRAGDADPERRGSGLAHRDVRRDVPARLQHRQPVADGDDDRHRLRRRRRDRRHREHHAAPREGRSRRARPPEIGAKEIGFTVFSISDLARRGLHPDPAHGRHRRAPLPRVRRDAVGGDPRLDGDLPDDDADDVRGPPAEPGEREARPALPLERARVRRGARRSTDGRSRP